MNVPIMLALAAIVVADRRPHCRPRNGRHSPAGRGSAQPRLHLGQAQLEFVDAPGVTSPGIGRPRLRRDLGIG